MKNSLLFSKLYSQIQIKRYNKNRKNEKYKVKIEYMTPLLVEVLVNGKWIPQEQSWNLTKERGK